MIGACTATQCVSGGQLWKRSALGTTAELGTGFKHHDQAVLDPTQNCPALGM